ncbi:MAG: response regulator transcription factor [Anaerolineaceae bacterium]|nr:response regulator transcription factor [Anaerolineaceae bacterium]
MNPVRIVVVDDHAILRDGIVSLLKTQAEFEVVGVAGSVADALEVVRHSSPDLVLLDYGLPDGTGLEATSEILALNPEINVVLLTVHEEDDLLFAAVRSGAKGYLLKNISAKDLLAKLRGLSQGDVALLPAQTKRILSEFAKTEPVHPPSQDEAIPLTERELEVLHLLVAGASNQEIGSKLHISVHTVKNHVHHILDKLNVETRRQAAELAIKKRLVSTGRF